MDEEELANLVVRLTGDGTEYRAMLKQAEQQTDATAQHIQTAAQRIEGFSKNLSGFAQSAINALGMLGVATSTNSMFSSFAKMEEGMIRLTAAIRVNGHEVQATTKTYMDLAKSIEQTTLVSKGEVLNMARRAETLGFTGDAAERVIRSSIGLARATDGEAESMVRVAAAMERGNLQLLRRIPELRGIHDQHELMIKAQALIVSGLEQEKQMMGTTSGQIELLGRSLKNLGREMGGMIDTYIKPIISWIREVVNWFNKLDPSIKTAIAATLLFMLAFKFVPTIIGWLTGAAASMKLFTATIVMSPITAWIVAIGVTIVVVRELAKEIASLNDDVRRLNLEMARGVTLDTARNTAFRESTRGIVERATNEANVQTRRDTLQDALAGAERELEGRQRNIAALERERDRLLPEAGTGGFLGLGRSIRGMFSEAPALVAQMEREIASLGTSTEDVTARVTQLRAELAHLSEDAFHDAIHKATDALTKEYIAIGKTKEELQRAELAARGFAAGLSAEKVAEALRNFDALTEKKKAADIKEQQKGPLDKFLKQYQELLPLLERGRITREEFNKALAGDVIEKTMTDTEKFNKELEYHNALLRGGVIGWEQYRRALGGDTIKSTMTQIEKFEEQLTSMNQLLRANVIGTEQWQRALGGQYIDAAMSSTEKFTEQQQLLNRLLQEGVISLEVYNKTLGGNVTREFMTGQEKFIERQEELNQMLDSGVISADTYRRAMEAARKTLEGMNTASQAAAAASSAEARARISAYLDVTRYIPRTMTADLQGTILSANAQVERRQTGGNQRSIVVSSPESLGQPVVGGGTTQSNQPNTLTQSNNSTVSSIMQVVDKLTMTNALLEAIADSMPKDGDTLTAVNLSSEG